MTFNRSIKLAGSFAAVLVFGSAAAFSAGSRPSPVPATAPAILVYKSPTCGCCTKWAEHMRKAGFAVTLEHPADLDAIKRQMGVLRTHASCHTAVVGGYVVEGHVPSADLRRLLKERPDARGLTVPGMPLAAPGMDGPNTMGFDVLLIHRDGTTSVFARYPAGAARMP